jgi:serine protease Do
MSRRFYVAIAGVSATIGLLFGLLVAGSLTPAPADSSPTMPRAVLRDGDRRIAAPVVTSFADVAERINPAVVNIDATSLGGGTSPRPGIPPVPVSPLPFDHPVERDREGPSRGTGTGFLIDPEGHILTSHHVVALADRLTVRLASGRSLSARRVGSDPDSDVALLKVDSPTPLPFVSLGDSDALRVGEWVVAVGNPLAYEHTVTVGIVSFIGRKLFNSSLDRYIQTDAAIHFGNSGGPLVDVRGEVIGINSAISSRSPNIGFAVPINQARAVLPQLIKTGRVSRGYIGVGPRDVDPDLQRSLGLRSAAGVLVQDVTEGSPGARAGLRPYDFIVAVDGKSVSASDQLIGIISSRRPGTMATLQVMRDGRPISVPVKLAERPPEETDRRSSEAVERPRPTTWRGPALGLSVREIDPGFAARTKLPDDIRGIVVSRVEPMSPAFDASLERGDVLIEINRQPVLTTSQYRRIISNAHAGDVLAVYLYNPRIRQRTLQTIRVE